MQQAGVILQGPATVMTMFDASDMTMFDVPCSTVMTMFDLPVDTSSTYAQAEKLEREAAQLKVWDQQLKQCESRQASEEGTSADSGQETEQDIISQCGWRSRSTSPVPCRPA